MQKEARKRERSSVLQPIEYLLAPSIINKTYEGVITDISDSGLCLITASPLKSRQRIILVNKSCSFEKTAIVRWIQKYDDILYKIGVEFTEDQAFMNIRDKRRFKRLNIRHLNLTGEMAFAHCIKIVDISIGGLLIETDKKWNVGEEYVLRVQFKGKQWPIRAYIVRLTLKDWKRDDQGNTIPIYRAGMKFTGTLDEMRDFLKCIKQKEQGEDMGIFPSNPRKLFPGRKI